MRGAIVETPDLLSITGYQKPGDAARCLRNQGIKVFSGRKGPWTTLALINAAGGVVYSMRQNDGTYDPDEVL